MTRRARPHPRPRRRRDPGGRILLCLFAVAFATVGIIRHDLSSIPLLAAATVLAILFAFHSRIGGSVGLGNASVPIMPDDSQPSWKPPELTDLNPNEALPFQDFPRRTGTGNHRRH
jgi:hypothetical protein